MTGEMGRVGRLQTAGRTKLSYKVCLVLARGRVFHSWSRVASHDSMVVAWLWHGCGQRGVVAGRLSPPAALKVQTPGIF